jgi:hypothetical protein
VDVVVERAGDPTLKSVGEHELEDGEMRRLMALHGTQGDVGQMLSHS